MHLLLEARALQIGLRYTPLADYDLTWKVTNNEETYYSDHFSGPLWWDTSFYSFQGNLWLSHFRQERSQVSEEVLYIYIDPSAQSWWCNLWQLQKLYCWHWSKSAVDQPRPGLPARDILHQINVQELHRYWEKADMDLLWHPWTFEKEEFILLRLQHGCKWRLS